MLTISFRSFNHATNIVEKPHGEEFPLFSPIDRASLRDVVERMKKAKDDKNVKAVVLLLDEVDLDLAQSEEFRQALDGIKAAGKEVYAHVDAVLMTRSLALVAGASRISATPTTIIIIAGFNAESPYVRGLLDAIGVKPDFLTCGEYKSAAEMFMRKGPSPAHSARTPRPIARPSARRWTRSPKTRM